MWSLTWHHPPDRGDSDAHGTAGHDPEHQEHHVTLGQAGEADTEERDQEEDSGYDDGHLPSEEF